MSAITANDMPVLVGSISMPRVGTWTCDFELDGDEVLREGTKLVIKDGKLEFIATVRRSGVVAGRVYVRAVGGAGKLGKDVEGRNYVDVPRRLPIRDTLGDVGEVLSNDSDESVMTSRLAHWTRCAVPAGSALAAIVEHAGATWRVLRDGTVWVGTETWPEQTIRSAEHLDPDPELGTFTIACDTFELRPGVTFVGRRVSRVEHRVDGGKARTLYWVEDADGPVVGALDRAKEPLARFIRWVMRDVTYHKLYQCTVQRQDADGNLDLLPDDESIRGQGTSKVPIRHGLPGFSVKVPVGARVLLGFQNGDSSKPYAALWEKGSVSSIAFDDGTLPMARLGDLVQCGGPGTIVTLLPLTGVGAPPNNAIVAGVPCMISFSSVPPTPILADPLYGAIAGGKQNFLG